MRWFHACGFGGAVVAGFLLSAAANYGEEPPTIDPFGKTSKEREDAVPGYVELSDGSIHPGRVYLTRDQRLKIYDEQLERQRDVPWETIREIECNVKQEWMEKEWRFKETTSDQKVYTGRSYPVREYVHTITLRDGRTLSGPLSAIVYVQAKTEAAAAGGPQPKAPAAERFLLNKRSKGKNGEELKSLVYVRRIKLGNEALEEGEGKNGQKGKNEKEQANRR